MIFVPKGEPLNTLHWSSDYSVNIPAIDNEHKLLVSIIIDIACSLHCQSSMQAEIIIESLHRLSNYIRAHFESEERFLLFNNYPEFTKHRMNTPNCLHAWTTSSGVSRQITGPSTKRCCCT